MDTVQFNINVWCPIVIMDSDTLLRYDHPRQFLFAFKRCGPSVLKKLTLYFHVPVFSLPIHGTALYIHGHYR
jgi:hypothetical protein